MNRFAQVLQAISDAQAARGQTQRRPIRKTYRPRPAVNLSAKWAAITGGQHA